MRWVFVIAYRLTHTHTQTAIPVEAARKTSHVAIAVTARGGHIGFLEGAVPTTPHNQYMARLFGEYFDAALNGNEFDNVSKQLTENGAAQK